MLSLADEMAETAAAVEAFLARRFADGEPSERLFAAIRHGALGGGKRLRPCLLRLAAGLYGVPPAASLAAAAALEMVHCYSLVHDDLPDMDNDRLRRGRPSVWAAFDPATAILAGDALLTEAFAVLAEPETHPDPAIRIRLVACLARRAGLAGMVGGQMRDIESEGEAATPAAVTRMQQMKTGDLIAAAMEMGGILGGEADTSRLARCGHEAGLAFQIADDILDATATSAALGKTAGKDAAQGKATLVALEGLDAARRRRDAAVEAAIALIAHHGERAARLSEAIRYLAARAH